HGLICADQPLDHGAAGHSYLPAATHGAVASGSHPRWSSPAHAALPLGRRTCRGLQASALGAQRPVSVALAEIDDRQHFLAVGITPQIFNRKDPAGLAWKV